jgi:membrane dipeptidase
MTDPLPTSPDQMSSWLAEAPVFDGHNDLPDRLRSLDGGRLDLADPGRSLVGYTHTDLERLFAGGVGAQFWSVYVSADLPEDEAVTQTVRQIDLAHRMVARYPHKLVMATTAAQCAEARRSGRIASLLGAEGGHSIATSLDVLRSLHRLGVRYMTLTHNKSTSWARSCTDEDGPGLSDFGREVVREMNRLGMIVDLSHVAVATMHDALEVSSRPVIFSHSSARSLVDHPRNVPDEVLERLGRSGGVCQVTFVPAFISSTYKCWQEDVSQDMRARGLDPTDHWARDRFISLREAYHPKPAVTLEDAAKHVDHVRQVAGVDHVGLGGDFDGTDDLPLGLEDVSGYPQLLACLVDSYHWSRSDVAKLSWHNMMRVVAACCD